MYAVTGATGQLGRLVINGLLEKVSPSEMIALARDPSAAQDIAQTGVTVRPFDYDAPDQLAAALQGVTRLLFISSDDVVRRIGQHRAVIDAAIAAKVEFIAYTSVIHADDNPISVAPSHRETEAMLRNSGITYAVLRNSWYIENYLIGADAAVAHGALLGSTGEGRISAASRADYAAAAVAVLTEPTPDSRVYELGGDDAFTLSDVAAALSEASGKPVTYHHLPEEAYRDALANAGVPAAFAATLASYSADAAGGILADDSQTLSRLIGRPTETLREIVLRELA
ncbi:SDR family oxidoreductase [Sphingomonas sp. CGMCC 1.13654]|uniref:SDR family oxidoreductase n=1 Tax=Sphingomonas chungangi TaxID=2683589 RepID=A0A838LA91_9SPHN|nr:SDR family oxidoreductase [Sphingomonas chungangi]MBA2935752.1 SDR family oxidoreductase [Sphingomonas chungangi]MVW54443.1 NAD(P)H-binding protein [Sphingomonas chungangi]